MPITVQEINEKEFGETLFHNYKGYDVDVFLDYVADEVEILLNTNKEQGERLSQFEEHITAIRQTEAELRQTLEGVKSSYEEIIRAAQNKAAEIVNDAQAKADRILADAQANGDAAAIQAPAESEPAPAEEEAEAVAVQEPTIPVCTAEPAPVQEEPAKMTLEQARAKLAEYAAQLMSQIKE